MAKQETTGGQKTSPSKDNNKTLKIVLIVIGAVIVLGLLTTFLFGWGVASVFKKAAEESGVNVNTGESQVTFENEDGQSTVAVGDDVELPDGFPSDVPIYEPSTTTYAAKNQENSYSVALQTDDSSNQVADFYAKELKDNGWAVKSQFNTSGGQSKSYQKGNRTLTLVISEDETDNQTAVTLTVTSS